MLFKQHIGWPILDHDLKSFTYLFMKISFTPCLKKWVLELHSWQVWPPPQLQGPQGQSSTRSPATDMRSSSVMTESSLVSMEDVSFPQTQQFCYRAFHPSHSFPRILSPFCSSSPAKEHFSDPVLKPRQKPQSLQLRWQPAAIPHYPSFSSQRAEHHHGFQKSLGTQQEVNEIPDPTEELSVLRGMLSFTRPSTPPRLHADHPAAQQETLFFFSHGFCHVFAGLLLL